MPEEDVKAEEKAEEAAPSAAAPKSGGFGSWLPLIITIILMPALAFGVAQFVILPQLQKGLGIKTETPSSSSSSSESKKESPGAKQQTVMMNKMLVNVAGTMGARYLLVSISVAGTATDFKDKMTEHDAQLRDMACGALATKTLADLEKPGARNLIRTELINGFNNILGDSMVQDIYFTEFAIQ
ncbi:MAG TPA: flagellar basal body-associated FliL family protein [Verrucomicrobiae bacterium]|jgi:flagellar FliL protein|nr:flagellar basal body-associated FliL family protein [Verrucomicrobiae bacterium]